jgi:hypothetical protein
MAEPISVHVEVWPVAADEVGVWLLSGEDAWRSGPVMADDEPHSEVDTRSTSTTPLEDVALLHSTSWRVDGPRLVLTYMAVLTIPGLARDAWPTALPVSLDLANAVGKPLPYGPTEPPTPRYIDVLLHGLRHMRFLLDTDPGNSAALDDYWRGHLATLDPALATMYNQGRRDATVPRHPA